MKTENRRRQKQGVVTSNKMAKTVAVRVERTFRHPVFEKIVTRAKKYYAHVEGLNIEVGQTVVIESCRPLSKLKRWRVIGVSQ